jgi:hypothetical protein
VVWLVRDHFMLSDFGLYGIIFMDVTFIPVNMSR